MALVYVLFLGLRLTISLLVSMHCVFCRPWFNLSNNPPLGVEVPQVE